MLKNPLVLEFLGMEEKAAYSESDMEFAIISKLQTFLLELGKEFLFEARQKRFTYDEDSFWGDLVFYNQTFAGHPQLLQEFLETLRGFSKLLRGLP